MYTAENFAADVAKHFAFLESDFGMKREPLGSSGGAWISYSNDVTRVTIEHEIGGYCGVSLVNLRHVQKDPLERSEFDLDEVLAVAGRQQPRRGEPRSMAEAVARAAELLRSHGAVMLKGDFEALHARQAKVVEAARKRNPPVN